MCYGDPPPHKIRTALTRCAIPEIGDTRALAEAVNVTWIPDRIPNQNMKTKINFSRPLKALLVAGLLAGTTVAFNAQATDIHWVPQAIYFDDLNNPYAYFDDTANWDLGVLPSFLYTNSVDGSTQTERVMDNTSLVTCVITNDVELFQMMFGSGGGGNVVVSNANV